MQDRADARHDDAGRRVCESMRFGLRLPSYSLGDDDMDLASMGAYLRHAEDLGFESALLIDHLLTAPPAYRVTWLEPLVLLSALTGVTRTIRLGTLVLVLPFRDPVLFAKEWATLDRLSGGRTILGVGVGWHEGEFEALRIPRTERGRRMNEMLEAVTTLWASDRASYEGSYYRFHDLTLEPKPVQLPRPPIWIGGGTQPSKKIYAQQVDTVRPVLERIARYADAWVPHSSATAEMVLGDWEVVQEYMASFGRSPGHVARVYSNFVHILEPGQAPETAADRFRVFSGMDMDYWQEFYLLGEAEAVAERIRAKVAALGGVDHVILNPLDWDIRALDRLANDVLPLLHD
jgi:probable F420-dependent oxidoreductase